VGPTPCRPSVRSRRALLHGRWLKWSCLAESRRRRFRMRRR
jgi:hypothetical protein